MLYSIMRLVLVALTAVALMPTTASALSERTKDDYTAAYYPAKKRCGKKPGLHLRKVPGEPSSRRYHLWTGKLNGMCLPKPVYAAKPQVSETAPPSQAPAGTQSPSVGTGGILSRIAACESGGNPGAVSGNGTYGGKYQFDQQTWGSVGGSGSPSSAPEAEQDKRAAMLYSQRGASAWPVCGK